MRARLSYPHAIASPGDFRVVVGALTIGPMNTALTSGPALRLQRRAAGLTVDAVARAMHADPAQVNRNRQNVSPARIRAIEAQPHVRPDTATRFLTALGAAHEARAAEAVAEAVAFATGDLVNEEDSST